VNRVEITLEDGRTLIKYARENIENYLQHGSLLNPPVSLKERFHEKSGAFVTLNRFQVEGNPLRGCIGYILPLFPLWETIQKGSIAAATDDPRFPPVKISEMDKIIIEISVLSIPEKIMASDPAEYLNQIVIGRDGLIITKGRNRGLLLPQVPVEHDRNWNVLTFIEQTCEKAWLSPDCWRDLKNTTVERFTATIYEETSPRGEIRHKEIGEESCSCD
jgi:uncharacterized protein (TIGR00296 family)